MATIKLIGLPSVNLQGFALRNGQVLEGLPVVFCFGYIGDSNLEVKFLESDRQEMREVDPFTFKQVGRSLQTVITTHDELCGLLLPSKPKAKKPLLKSKKSTLGK